LKVEEATAGLIKDVLAELKVTKECSHPNVVHVLGLMVGPGRIGKIEYPSIHVSYIYMVY